MEKLGIEPVQLLLQVVNFLLLLYLLKKYLYKPVLKLLDERKKKIDEGLDYSDKMKKQLEESEKKRQEIIKNGKTEARKLVEEARKEARKKEDEIIEKAQKEAIEITNRAHQETEALRRDLEKELNKKAVEIAEKIVNRVIADALTEKTQRAIIDKKLKEVGRKYK